MNKAWIIIWSIVAIIAIIGILTGAIHCLLWLGIAVGFIAGEYGELQQEQRKQAEKHGQEAGRD